MDWSVPNVFAVQHHFKPKTLYLINKIIKKYLQSSYNDRVGSSAVALYDITYLITSVNLRQISLQSKLSYQTRFHTPLLHAPIIAPFE